MQNWIAQQLTELRQQKPLVTNITNFVVMNNTANALLAIGASPIMAHSRQEITDLLKISGALVINIGTLDECWIERMLFAVQQAVILQKPIIVDPVGCGASTLRTNTAKKLITHAQNLTIRGNASEIMALADVKSESQGVDAKDDSKSAILAGIYLRDQFNCDVIISGATDFVITDRVYKLENGHSMMPFVTGMGCTHSALTAAFTAVAKNKAPSNSSTVQYPAGLAATAILGIAGQMAAEKSQGPGSLQMHLLDVLYTINASDISKYLKLEITEI